MEALLETLRDTFERFEPLSALDILIIAAIIYWLLLLVRGTTAMPVLRGIVIVLAAAFVLGRVLDLLVLNWLLRHSLPALLLAIPIIFQPEIRRALERLGRTGVRAWFSRPSYDGVIDVVTGVAASLAQQRHGALLVLERETGLEDYIDTGVRVDAEPSEPLLEGLFFPNSPLHDGAVILRGNRVMAASCTLPLSDHSTRDYPGTRHRAALGISERTDAVAVVVSEETGDISVAVAGRLVRHLDRVRLRATLASILSPVGSLASHDGGGAALGGP